MHKLFFNMEFKRRDVFMKVLNINIRSALNMLVLSFFSMLFSFFISKKSYSGDQEIVFGRNNAFPIQLNYRQINLPSDSHIKFVYFPPSGKAYFHSIECRHQWYYSSSYMKEGWSPQDGIGIDKFISSLSASPISMSTSDISCLNGLLVNYGKSGFPNFESQNIDLFTALSSNIEQNGNIIDLLDNLNEIPSTVEPIPIKNIDLFITFEKIKTILESSIKNWIENGYTITDILNVFQSIKELIDELSNNIDFNQSLRQLMYSSL